MKHLHAKILHNRLPQPSGIIGKQKSKNRFNAYKQQLKQGDPNQHFSHAVSDIFIHGYINEKGAQRGEQCKQNSQQYRQAIALPVRRYKRKNAPQQGKVKNFFIRSLLFQNRLI